MSNNSKVLDFFKRYFTYDNEYISGNTYFLRLTLWPILAIFFFLPGIYWIAVVGYKRGKSLGWSKSACYITSILMSLSPLISWIIAPYAIISISIHFLLWFSDSKEKSDDESTLS